MKCVQIEIECDKNVNWFGKPDWYILYQSVLLW